MLTISSSAVIGCMEFNTYVFVVCINTGTMSLLPSLNLYVFNRILL